MTHSPNDVELLNLLAFALAAAPEPHLRNGARALALAERAASDGQPRPATLDAWAAALAELARFEEAVEAAEVALAIARSGSLLAVQTWPEIRSNLLKAVGIEKLLVYFIVLILIVFTGSMILLMLTLTVIEKTKDVGVLMSLGAPPWGVTNIFLFNGLLISMLGTGMGLGLGYAFSANINEIHDLIYAVSGVELFPAEIYQMDRIPVHFQPADILWCTCLLYTSDAADE